MNYTTYMTVNQAERDTLKEFTTIFMVVLLRGGLRGGFYRLVLFSVF